jgi:hypothetical protein
MGCGRRACDQAHLPLSSMPRHGSVAPRRRPVPMQSVLEKRPIAARAGFASS